MSFDMRRYFKRATPKPGPSSSQSVQEPSRPQENLSSGIGGSNPNINVVKSSTRVDLNTLPVDPGERPSIDSYHPNDRDIVRRAYLQKGPYQPRTHNFQQTKFGEKMRRFNVDWFHEFPYWLEYSVKEEAAFCLCCYLFKSEIASQGRVNSFVYGGFRGWNKKARLEAHVGKCGSAHNVAIQKCQDLMKQPQSIQSAFDRQTEEAKSEYRVRLEASIDCVRFLLRQGLSFRGHNEYEDSSNRGNFLELLKFYAAHNEKVSSVVLSNAPGNHQMVAPSIQKDIVYAAAKETCKAIIAEIGDDFFGILVDESADVSCKEQMAVALRYVDERGFVMERFIGIIHVTDTSAISLKTALDSLLAEHGLSLSRIRGQGYDGASNMQGEFNGLKALIMKESKSAYCVHCFAHQLQLTLIAVAKNHFDINDFFDVLARLLNVVGGSCKRRDKIREKQAEQIAKSLQNEELESGRGLNQEMALKRPADTRWGSHYGTLLNLMAMFSSIIHVLEDVEKHGTYQHQRGEAHRLLELLETFDFIFCLHLMFKTLGITNELNLALQRKDQDIVNAMVLVEVAKQRLQQMRDEGWDALLNEVQVFCNKHEILVPNMEDAYVKGRRRKTSQCTNLHRYQVDLFYSVIDMQLQELNGRFNEVNTELLLCIACLSPSDSFSSFNVEKLLKMAKFYPCEFSDIEILALKNQLDNYIVDVHRDARFANLKGIGDLSKKMVETKKHNVYPLVYLLLKMALILPVATSTVERAFSAMKLIKNRLRNKMSDDWLNDCLLTYIEKDVFDSVTNDAVMYFFQNMKSRRGQL